MRRGSIRFSLDPPTHPFNSTTHPPSYPQHAPQAENSKASKAMSAAEIEAKKLEHKLARFNKDKAAARKVVQTMLEKVSLKNGIGVYLYVYVCRCKCYTDMYRQRPVCAHYDESFNANAPTHSTRGSRRRSSSSGAATRTTTSRPRTPTSASRWVRRWRGRDVSLGRASCLVPHVCTDSTVVIHLYVHMPPTYTHVTTPTQVLSKLQEEQAQLSRNLNKKVMHMIEKVEGEYADLEAKLGTIENDKVKVSE